MVGYDLMTRTAVKVITRTIVAKMVKATRHLFAHFLSVFLRRAMSSWRSASDLVGSQPSGAESGEMRIMIPASQKMGNTAYARK